MSERPYIQHGRRHGAGGSDPIPSVTERAQYYGAGNAVPDGVTVDMDWGSLIDDDDLLDLSTSTAPTVKESGVYAVTVTIRPNTNALTVGGSYHINMQLDASGDGAGTDGQGVSTASEQFPDASVSLVWFVPAGGVLKTTVTNFDGGGVTLDCAHYAVIQRLS